MTDPKEFKRQKAEFVQRDVPISSIKTQADQFSFRDKDRLKAASVQTLADEIKESGVLISPLLVVDLGDGTYEVRDGHRRTAAVNSLVEDSAAVDWTPQTLVPVRVVTNDLSLADQLVMAAAANLHRAEFTNTERARAANMLYKENVPKVIIQSTLKIKETQLERDLLVGETEWMLTAIVAKQIKQTTAGELLRLAKENDREDEFKSEFDDWVAKTRLHIRDIEKARKRNGEEPLKKEAKEYHKFLTTAQVREWKEAMQQERPFGEPAFRFGAVIKNEKGIQSLKIDSLSKNINELRADEIQMIAERLLKVGKQLAPIAARMKAETASEDESLVFDEVAAELGRYGLEPVIKPVTDGDKDSIADETGDNLEKDHVGDIELPSEDGFDDMRLLSGFDEEEAAFDEDTDEIKSDVADGDKDSSADEIGDNLEKDHVGDIPLPDEIENDDKGLPSDDGSDEAKAAFDDETDEIESDVVNDTNSTNDEGGVKE